MDGLENKAEGEMGKEAMGGMGGGSGGSGMDKEIDQGVDKAAQDAGMPSAGDGMLNKEVNSEVGKFT